MSKPIIIFFFFLFSCNKENRENSNSIDTSITTETIELHSKISKSAFAEEQIFGIWKTNINNPNPDFKITKSSFSTKDDGLLRYEIIDNKIKIRYPNYEKTGLIKKAENDSLIIYWASGEFQTYVRQPQ